MTLVHSNEPFSGLAIALEATWGTAVAAGGTHYSVPLVVPGETMALRRDQIAPPRIFGGTGARESIEYGRSFTQGSFTVQGRYDAKWFNILLSHAMWGEVVVQDFDVLGAAIAGTTANTHLYRPGAAVPLGLTMRIWKAGPGPAASGWLETFAGCMITSFTIEQAGDQPPLWTFTFVGKSVALAAANTTALPSVTGAVFQKFRDLSTGAAYFKSGATPTALNISGYRLLYDRRLEVDAAFANAPDATSQPGATDLRQVTLEINSLLEQDYYADHRPYKEFVNGTQSKVDIYYESLTAVNDKKYGMRIELPAIGWDVGQASLSDPANPPTRFNATAIVGNLDVTGGLPGTTPGDFTSDMRIGVTLKTVDELAPDAVFGTGWAV